MIKQKRFYIVIIGVVLIVIFGIVSITLSSGTVYARISFTGDVMMHGPVQSCAFRNNILDARKQSRNNRGYDYLFAHIRPEFENGDMTVANMEFPVAFPYRTRGLVFNCFPEIIPAMKKAGITHVTLGNNHSLDQGIPGLRATIKHLEDYEMPFLGVHRTEKQSRKFVLFKKEGLAIAVIGYTNLMNYPRYLKKNGKGFFLNHLSNEKDISDDIGRARKQADYIILVAHAGLEYKIFPERSERLMYKKYCDRGVDLVIGHHPHVIQPVEEYKTADGRNSYIFYSLGNFISNQTRYSLRDKRGPRISTQDSFIVNSIITKNDGAVKASFELVPVTTRNILYRTKNGRYKDIQIVSFSKELERLRSSLKKSPSRRNKNMLKIMEKRLGSLKKVMLWYNPGPAVTIVD